MFSWGLNIVRVRVRVTLDWRFSANQFILATSPLRMTTRKFLIWILALIVHMEHSTLSVAVYVLYNSCWPSPAQSFSGPTPAGLVTRFYILRFKTPPTWWARSPYLHHPWTGWLGYTPRHWVPFPSPPTIRRSTVEVFDPSSVRDTTEYYLFWTCT
jgi:hypothetical protein